MITIHDLSVVMKRKTILSNINLSCGPGIYAVIGANGAGKTTLFRSILELQRYTGSICCDAVANKKVGYLPQSFETLKGLSVYDALKYFACLKKIPKKQWEDEIHRVLAIVNLMDEKDKQVGRLSGGMNQRLGIAQAILGTVDLLVLDEPTVGLDPGEKLNFRSTVENIYKANPDMIILISSHETIELENICQNVIFIHKGQVSENDKIQNLFAKYGADTLEQVYLKVITSEG